MSRVGIDEIGDREVVRLCAAASPARTQRMEIILGGANIDYAIVEESFRESNFAFTATQGSVFYVAAAQAPYARELLTDAGMPVGVVDEDLLDY